MSRGNLGEDNMMSKFEFDTRDMMTWGIMRGAQDLAGIVVQWWKDGEPLAPGLTATYCAAIYELLNQAQETSPSSDVLVTLAGRTEA
jgi:hypothetical protein